VPHCRAQDAVAAETPVILTTDGESLPHHDVLLNLHREWPPFFSTFERLLEVVTNDEEDRQSARARYQFYRQRGYEIKVNAITNA
jgi:DNA polymerase-3 subunit chi